MAKTKSSTRRKAVYSKVKDPVKPKWMRATRVVTMILLYSILVMIIAGIMISYYRRISNHK